MRRFVSKRITFFSNKICLSNFRESARARFPHQRVADFKFLAIRKSEKIQATKYIVKEIVFCIKKVRNGRVRPCHEGQPS